MVLLAIFIPIGAQAYGAILKAMRRQELRYHAVSMISDFGEVAKYKVLSGDSSFIIDTIKVFGSDTLELKRDTVVVDSLPYFQVNVSVSINGRAVVEVASVGERDVEEVVGFSF